jgi:histidinol phosphatase-like PHP family hydrolase
MREESRVDLHTHSLLSDGLLLPSELLRRAEAMQFGAMAITDHVDSSNLQQVMRQLLQLRRDGADGFSIAFVPGVKITHVPPRKIAALARKARQLGARLVVVHGETSVEPVVPGTNRAAVECPDVDILAHPGFIEEKDALLAAANSVVLELSARAGHCLTNGHVAHLARVTGVLLVVNTDTHAPSDMLDQAGARRIARGAGLSEDETHAALVTNAWALVSRALRPVLQHV